MPAFRVDPLAIADGALTPAAVTASARRPACGHDAAGLFQRRAGGTVHAVQARLGRDKAGHLVEDLLAAVAAALPDAGFRRLLVAGGETSGAVVAALGVRALAIGPEIDPGVPWTLSLVGGRPWPSPSSPAISARPTSSSRPGGSST